MSKTASKKNSTSKKYLRILGIVYFVLAALIVLSTVVMMVTKTDVNKLGIDLTEIRKIEGATDDVIRVSYGICMIIAGLLVVLEGWLLRRAAKDPSKSTLLLVLLVLSVVTSVVSIFTTNNFDSISKSASFALGLTINILALMSVVNIRKEIKE